MIREKLAELSQRAGQSTDETFKGRNSVRYEAGLAPEAFLAIEARLGCSLPESYKRFVTEHGLLSVGEEEICDVFQLVDDAEIRTLHDKLAEDYEAETTEEIAEAIGIELATVAATKHGVVFAMDGYEDYWVFDMRSRDSATEEPKVVGLELVDMELEYFAKRTDYAKWLSFEPFVVSHLEKRATAGYLVLPTA